MHYGEERIIFVSSIMHYGGVIPYFVRSVMHYKVEAYRKL